MIKEKRGNVPKKSPVNLGARNKKFFLINCIFLQNLIGKQYDRQLTIS